VQSYAFVEWPAAFYALRRGEGCPLCGPRPSETRYGIRFFAGAACDAYLQRAAIQRGYTVVIWRGRHVAEPTDLTRDEATAYWLELLRVGSALERHLQPVKVNYDILGNAVPHLHTHVIPRFADDPRPGWPFPFPDEPHASRDETELRADVAALAALLAGASG
jgi:diadenosine tetraphosphate (Ap4A) HIT family hydrolase